MEQTGAETADKTMFTNNVICQHQQCARATTGASGTFEVTSVGLGSTLV